MGATSVTMFAGDSPLRTTRDATTAIPNSTQAMRREYATASDVEAIAMAQTLTQPTSYLPAEVGAAATPSIYTVVTPRVVPE